MSESFKNFICGHVNSHEVLLTPDDASSVDHFKTAEDYFLTFRVTERTNVKGKGGVDIYLFVEVLIIICVFRVTFKVGFDYPSNYANEVELNPFLSFMIKSENFVCFEISKINTAFWEVKSNTKCFFSAYQELLY